MKEIKYTSDQIFAVANLLQQVFNLYPATNCDQKATRSIAYDLEEKFTAKRKQLIKKRSLFEEGKTYKVSLKYHEELALQRIIYDLVSSVQEEKPRHDLQTIHNLLHKRLQ